MAGFVVSPELVAAHGLATLEQGDDSHGQASVSRKFRVASATALARSTGCENASRRAAERSSIESGISAGRASSIAASGRKPLPHWSSRRSAERREGKECGSTCRSWGSPDTYKKNTKRQ